MKREAGENPAQGRCCIRPEVQALRHCDSSREGRLDFVTSRKSEDLPVRSDRGASDLGRRAGRTVLCACAHTRSAPCLRLPFGVATSCPDPAERTVRNHVELLHSFSTYFPRGRVGYSPIHIQGEPIHSPGRAGRWSICSATDPAPAQSHAHQSHDRVARRDPGGALKCEPVAFCTTRQGTKPPTSQASTNQPNTTSQEDNP